MAAPLKNMNALRNGSRVCRLILGTWPSCLNRVQRFTRQYRETLEHEVVASHGSVDIMAAHLIDAACQHEATRQVCRWILRQRWDELSPADIERNTKSMADSTDKRNAAVARLGLEQKVDVWAALDRTPTAITADGNESADGEHDRQNATDDAVAGSACDEGNADEPEDLEPPTCVSGDSRKDTG